MSWRVEIGLKDGSILDLGAKPQDGIIDFLNTVKDMPHLYIKLIDPVIELTGINGKGYK